MPQKLQKNWRAEKTPRAEPNLSFKVRIPRNKCLILGVSALLHNYGVAGASARRRRVKEGLSWAKRKRKSRDSTELAWYRHICEMTKRQSPKVPSRLSRKLDLPLPGQFRPLSGQSERTADFAWSVSQM